jgi:DNA-binding SARP family transcriptional activator
VETRSSGATPLMASNGLVICALGEIRVLRNGEPAPLPASKRTRALLGYLVATGVRQTRQTLCDLLWDGPDDPRAALRWSLTKLRPVVNENGVERLVADREHISFSPLGAAVDVGRVDDLLGRDPSSAELKKIEEAAALLQGEFLDGLDLPSCYRFHHWCLAERERWGALRRQVLALALERLADKPERSLPYARALVASDPLSEWAHGKLVALLSTMGRRKDAETHYDYARQMLQREIGAPLVGDLRRPVAPLLYGHSQSKNDNQVVAPRAEAKQISAPVRSASLFGRTNERQSILAALDALFAGAEQRGLLLLGEPGIGKSRLLEFVATTASERGAHVLAAKCFEAEAVRPYGCWLDALGDERVLSTARRDLAPMLPLLDDAGGNAGDRTGFFMKMRESLNPVDEKRPVVLIFDDLQWIDEGSSSLLHYIVRSDNARRLLFVGAARAEEIDDNAWCRRLVSGLTQDRAIERISLAPLGEEDAAQLFGSKVSANELANAMKLSGGNPLFLIELARAGAPGAPSRGRDLDALIADRIARLDEPEREMMIFASAMSRDFKPELLGEAMGLPEAKLIERIDRLVRRSLLTPRGDGRFDFAHDLIRQTTYRGLSQPSRRLIHRQIARVLRDASRADSAFAGELAYHAGAAGDHALAVEACTLAGEHCLRLFANAAAIDAADRGLGHLELLPVGADRAHRHIALLNITVFATATLGVRPKRNLFDELRRAVEAAELLDLHEDVTLGWYLISWWTKHSNDMLSARQAIMRAEVTSRPVDQVTRCQQLASAGRCLFEVEGELLRARAFIEEAGKLATDLDRNFVELDWGRGLIARWDGDLLSAQAWMRRALELARLREDRWREVECLVWVAKIALEAGRIDEVGNLCEEIDAMAGRLGEGRAPVADALRTVANMRSGRVDGAQLRLSISALRALDDKAQLAYVLNEMADCLIANGRLEGARDAAVEALDAARIVRQTTEIVVAASNLARAGAVGEGLKLEAAELGDLSLLSARARSAWKKAGTTLAIPTRAQTAAP